MLPPAPESTPRGVRALVAAASEQFFSVNRFCVFARVRSFAPGLKSRNSHRRTRRDKKHFASMPHQSR